jgi:ankyrin repeat protein
MSLVELLSVESLLLLIDNIQKETSDKSTKSLNLIFRDLIREEVHLEVIELLVQNIQIDLSYKIYEDQCIFHWACHRGYCKLVEILLQNSRIDPSSLDNLAIQLAIQENHIETVKLLLLDTRIDPSSSDNFCLRISSISGYYEILELLLDHPKINPKNISTIQLASQEGHIDIVKLLLSDLRADPSIGNNCSLRIALQKGHFEIAELLLQQPMVSLSNCPMISGLPHNDHSQIIEYLINNKKIDISCLDNSLICDALREGHYDIVKALLCDPRINISKITDVKILKFIKVINLMDKI